MALALDGSRRVYFLAALLACSATAAGTPPLPMEAALGNMPAGFIEVEASAGLPRPMMLPPSSSGHPASLEPPMMLPPSRSGQPSGLGQPAEPLLPSEPLQGMSLLQPQVQQPPLAPQPSVLPQQGISLSQSQVSDVAAATASLASSDASLRSQMQRENGQMQKVLKKIATTKAMLDKQRRATRKLEQEVLHERQAADACKGEVQAVEGPKSQQVRRAELLRLRSSTANTQAIQGRITQTEQEVADFKRSGDSQLGAMRGALARMTQQVAAAREELKEETSGRASVENELRVAETKVKVLRDKLAANGMGVLLANNSQLKSSLQQAQRQLEVSEATVARAGLAAGRARDAAELLRKSAEADSTQARKIARASLADVVSVEKEDAALTAKTEASARQARSLVLDSCDQIWDQLHPEILSALQRCEQTKLDLQSATAELASMSSIMSASGARAKVEVPQGQ